jgi:hypothetical protein
MTWGDNEHAYTEGYRRGARLLVENVIDTTRPAYAENATTGPDGHQEGHGYRVRDDGHQASERKDGGHPFFILPRWRRYFSGKSLFLPDVPA